MWARLNNPSYCCDRYHVPHLHSMRCQIWCKRHRKIFAWRNIGYEISLISTRGRARRSLPSCVSCNLFVDCQKWIDVSESRRRRLNMSSSFLRVIAPAATVVASLLIFSTVGCIFAYLQIEDMCPKSKIAQSIVDVPVLCIVPCTVLIKEWTQR